MAGGDAAGSWGRWLPLTGFAVPPADGYADQIEIVYQGHFAKGGAVGPNRNGELCVSQIADDPLQAVLLQLIKRARSLAREEPFPDSCRAPESQRSSDTPHDREQHIPERPAPTSQDVAFEARVDEAISPAEEPHTPVTDISPREQSLLHEATAMREAGFAE
jgi:hypothetical protein